jgi:hypothetical protein
MGGEYCELVSWMSGIVLREKLEEGGGLMDGYKIEA